MGKDKDENGGPLSGEDRTLWDFFTRNIRPLDKTHRKAPDARVPLPAAPAKPKPEPEPLLSVWKIPGFGLKPAENGAAPTQNGLDRRTSDRLKRGEMMIERRLDLHGLRQSEAQDRLTRFLLEAYDSDCRCVLVITGKGNRFQKQEGEAGQETGVLRRHLPVWIGMTPLSPIVLSYSKAKPKDGGDGAFYILLRRRR